MFEAFPQRAGGGELRTQYLSIPDTGAFAVKGSRPTWLWGFEHGFNEHRVAIGNEKLFTREDPARAPDGLIGMDLVRLGLERGRTADRAVEVICELIEEHGQGGECDHVFGDRYFSSFLVADPSQALVLETTGRQWVVRRVDQPGGGVAISNRVSTGREYWRACSSVVPGSDIDRWRDPGSPTGHADFRLAAMRAAVDPEPGCDRQLVSAGAAPTPGDFAAVLRHHGDGPWGSPEDGRGPGGTPLPSPIPDPEVGSDGTNVTVCMHVRDYSVTAASMIVSLPADPGAPMQAWVAPSSPCVSMFVPIDPASSTVPPCLSAPDLWCRVDQLRQRAERGDVSLDEIRAVLGPAERDLWRGSVPRSDRAACETFEQALQQLGV